MNQQLAFPFYVDMAQHITALWLDCTTTLKQQLNKQVARFMRCIDMPTSNVLPLQEKGLAENMASQSTPDLFPHKAKRGGYRKKEYGEPTKAMKVPCSRIGEVKAYLKGELYNEDRQLLDELTLLIWQWQEKTEPYSERPRDKQGHMRGACDLLKALQAILDKPAK